MLQLSYGAVLEPLSAALDLVVLGVTRTSSMGTCREGGSLINVVSTIFCIQCGCISPLKSLLSSSVLSEKSHALWR